jgi:hypothetical protein
MVHHAQAFPTGIRSSTHQIWWYILWSAKSEVCQEEEQFHGLIDIEQNEYSTPHIRAQKMFVWLVGSTFVTLTQVINNQ